MGTPNSVIQPLQKIQNFAARLVLLAPRHHHSTLLEKLHWLSISEHIRYKVTYMYFCAVNGSGLAYLSELLHVYIPSCTLCSSSDTCLLKIQQYKCKTHGIHTLLLWNSLPQDLQPCHVLKPDWKPSSSHSISTTNNASFCYSHCVCVCVHVCFPYTSCKLFW